MKLRTCSKCKVEKPLEEGFYRRGAGYRKTCKICRHGQSGVRDPEHDKAVQRARYKKNREYWIKEKGGCCQDCKGVFETCQYDFHHEDPSQKEIGVGVVMQHSRANQEKELAKCILLCANCHRLRHKEY